MADGRDDPVKIPLDPETFLKGFLAVDPADVPDPSDWTPEQVERLRDAAARDD